MKSLLPALLLLAAACGNSDNVIVGAVGPGDTTPQILFDNIGSSIHGVATLYDAQGNPTGAKVSVVIMSDRPNLCAKLTAQRDYFRNPTEAYEALILVVPRTSPPDAPGARVGTFFIGLDRDAGTQAEIVAVRGPQVPTPFIALNSSWIAVTDWSDNSGEAKGSFNMTFADPYDSGLAHPFYGRFKTNPCPSLDGTLLP